MRLTTFLKGDFKRHKSGTAFFLGNGINNYSKTANSWEGLLVELAKQHIGKGDNYKEILDDKSVTYPEFFDIIQLSGKDKDETFDYKSIKKEFKQAFNIWKPQESHKIWTEKIMKLDRPILTTNYDFLLELSNEDLYSFMVSKQYDKRKFRPLRTKKGRDGFTPFYPWHNYYSNKIIKDANSEFAIWHIHGFCEYASSIRLGLSDYMGIVERARRWLRKAKGNPLFRRKELDSWVGKNSWLDVMFHNHLLIVGIDLGTQETALRWMLLEREKFYRQNESLRKKTWYVVVKGKEFKKGKRLFFEKLNIEIIEANSYDQIYKTIPKHI